MKIICDSCRTKYSISDDKVKGKVFKIRCKKCQNIIVVRGSQSGAEGAVGEEQLPEEDAGKLAGPDAKDAPVWHLVVGHEQVGPMTTAEIQDRMSRGEINTETYVWKEGFSDWQRLGSVAELANIAGSAPAPAAPEAAPAEPQAWSAPPEREPAAWDAAAPSVGEAWGERAPAEPAPSGGRLFGPAAATDPASDLFGSQSGHESGARAGVEPLPGDNLFRAAPAPSGGGDLFGGSGNGGGQVFSAEEGGGGVQMTGARHENSVLFSLSNLQALAMGGKGPSTAPAPQQGSGSGSGSGAGAGDGSGLIDIRGMAAPPAAPTGSRDELPDFGGYSAPIAAAPVLLPAIVEERPRWIIPTVIAVGGSLVLAVVVLVVVLLFRKPEPVPVVYQQPPGIAPPQTAPEKKAPAVEKKPDEAKTAAVEPGEGKAAPGEDGKGKGARKSGKKVKGKKSAGVQVAQNEPPAEAPRSSGGGKTGARKGAGKPDALDDLINNAIGGGSKPKTGRPAKAAGAAPAGASSNLPDQPSRSDIVAGMNRVKGRVQGCYDKFRVPGMATMGITIAPSGTVSAARVKGMFAGTPTGACLQSAVKTATFPRFKGAAFSVNYPFILR